MLFLPARAGRGSCAGWPSLVSLVPLALSIWLVDQLTTPAGPVFQFVEQIAWYAAIDSSFHLGVDGISLPMVLLTTLLTPLAILISCQHQRPRQAYMALFLFLETGMLGVFMSLDLLLFFVFWEIGLVPMYFLINQWGSANRNYASFKFMIYTMAGSLGLLLAIQLIGLTVRHLRPDRRSPRSGRPTTASLSVAGLPVADGQDDRLLGLRHCLRHQSPGLAVPHLAAGRAHRSAHRRLDDPGGRAAQARRLRLPAPGAAALSRSRRRPSPGRWRSWPSLAIVLGAFASWGQTDFKRLVAYSSVNHMGFVVLGIAAAAKAYGTLSADEAVIAVNGAVLQMFNHGLSAAGMFFLVGVIYERTHTRNLNDFGGLFPLVPVYGGILIFTAMASLGLPGLNGFVSEFMVVRGAWPIFSAYTALAMIGLLFTGAYILKAIGRCCTVR